MRKAIGAVAAAAFVLFLFIAAYCVFGVSWGTKPIEREKLSAQQTDIICEKLEFGLNPGEYLSATFWPGFMQATTSLTVYINNMQDAEGFSNTFELPDFEKLSDSGRIKDYKTYVTLINKNGADCVQIHIHGFILQLEDVYKLLDDPFQPYLSNNPFMAMLAVEALLAGALLILIAVYAYERIKGIKAKIHDNPG